MTQVLTVVMISHMFLNLKGGVPRAQDWAKSNDVTLGPMDRGNAYQAPVSLDDWFSAPDQISSIVGNLGNGLVHTSHWTT